MTPDQLKIIRHSLPQYPHGRGPGRPANGGNGWTQRAFALQLGLSPRTYEGYEREGATVPVPIAKLARMIAKTSGGNLK